MVREIEFSNLGIQIRNDINEFSEYQQQKEAFYEYRYYKENGNGALQNRR